MTGLHLVPLGQSALLAQPATCGCVCCGVVSWLAGSSELELEDEFEQVVKRAVVINNKHKIDVNFIIISPAEFLMGLIKLICIILHFLLLAYRDNRKNYVVV